MKPTTNFDHFAESYDCALDEALNVSGEQREYFARGRVEWLAQCLRQMEEMPRHVMDYGCGTGATSPLLLDCLRADTVIGVDPSLRSLDVARQKFSSARIDFRSLAEFSPAGSLDVAYCNGVFHHISPGQRKDCLGYIRESLRPGGLFALWENNYWNPGTRYIMAHCAFDRDAITLTSIQGKTLLQSVGFEILRTDFLFVFPRVLGALRPIEKKISWLPLGAQYQILCRRPVDIRR